MAYLNQRRRGGGRGVVVVASIVVLALIGLLVWSVKTGPAPEALFAAAPAPQAPPPPAEYRPMLVVLPFNNLSEDRGEEWFNDGVTEDIIKELTRFQGFLVAARNTSFEFKGKNADINRLRRIGVRYVVEGSARRADGRLRINAQLIDTATGTYVWAEKYDRPLADIFLVQEELSDKIVGTIAAHIKRKEGERALAAPPEKLEAYELTTQAYMLNLAGGKENTFAARKLAERAIARDPGYALGWRMLAVTSANIYGNRWNEEFGDPTVARRGLDAAAQAVKLAPKDGLVRSSYAAGLMRNREFTKADAEAAAALALSPNDAIILNNVSVTLLNAQKWDEAETLLKRAIALDPFYSPAIQGNNLAQALYQKRDYAGAVRHSRECVDRVATAVNCAMVLTAALGQSGAAGDARGAAAELERRSPGYTIAEGLRAMRESMRNPAATDHVADGLRKAGVPE